jgi:vacuolar-type H+-ATPase subunit E/Vma4
MNLEPLRTALRAEVEADAHRRRTELEAACERRVAEAKAKATALTQQGQLDGAQAAALQAARRRAAANRRARELRLEAQRALLDELRARAREAALRLRTDPRYPELLDRLSRAARSQLGPEAELVVDPPELGGVLGRVGSVSVDYTLPALVNRALDELNGRLEALWE